MSKHEHLVCSPGKVVAWPRSMPFSEHSGGEQPNHQFSLFFIVSLGGEWRLMIAFLGVVA